MFIEKKSSPHRIPIYKALFNTVNLGIKKLLLMKKDQNAIFFWAIFFIAGGGILLMRNFGMLDFTFPYQLISWRLIPLIIGINAVLRKDYMNGIIAISIAVIFSVPDFLTPAERAQYYKLWPLLLVGAGLVILLKYLYPKSFDVHDFQTTNSEYNHINESNIMAGSSRKYFSKDFTGGKISCIMGGSQVDLTEADLLHNSVINIFILMGGIELRIPKEWNVQLDILPIMGGVEDKITKYPENVVNKDKRLVLTGHVFMGGVEIKRY